MTKYFILFISAILLGKQLKAQDTLRLDTTKVLQEVVITYQADKQAPITFQNIYSKDIKAKLTGQEPKNIS